MILRRFLLILSLFTLSVVFPSLASSQDLNSEQKLSSASLEELKKWLKDDAKYEKWYKLYGNKALQGKLHHRPEPPVWLEAECLGLIGGEGILVKACTLYVEIHEGAGLTKIRKTLEEERKQKEAPSNTKWYERVHLGGGWSIVSNVGQAKYGAVVETHVSIVGVGRFEINLPGIMFLSLPNMADKHGRRILKQATDLGISLKLKTFTFPGSKQQYIAHFNVSNAKVMNGWFSGFAEQDTLTLAGLSFTLKK